jgi:hypothetical protein
VHARIGDERLTATHQFQLIQQQATQGKCNGRRGQDHQQINLAVVASVAMAHRAEHP